MKFCQPHWDELRKAVDDRGLSHLVAGDGQKAFEAMARELEGRPEPGDWDPLMAAHWAITAHALECGGLYLMGEDEQGNQYCPLCEAAKHKANPTEWINGCADAMLENARQKNLVPGIQ